MKSTNTWRLFGGALALFLFIYFYESRDATQRAAAATPTVLGRLAPREITGIEYRMSNQVMRAERTNESWRLTIPSYPAQVTPIISFLESLTALPKIEVISPSEVAGKLKEFGLEPPAAVVSINVGSNRHQIQIGARTPIGENVYVQMAGSGEVIVTDGALLKVLPASVDKWRSPMLAQLNGRKFDHIQIRGGQRLLEFERDPLTQIWRISKPTPARANNDRIELLLQQLNNTQVKQFITDVPVVDLERYGLQPPALELVFTLDTNRVTSFEFGSSPTNDPAVVYVRRMMHTNIVTVPRELLNSFNPDFKSFHDPRLIAIDPAQLSQIQVNGTNGFTLVKITNSVWRITEPTPMAVDPELLQLFLTKITDMQIVDFAKDVPSDADLKQFGLAPPALSIALFGIRTNTTGALTNALLTELGFGTNKTVDTVHVRRSDEIPVYVTPLADVIMLPKFAWQLRDRRVFNFAPTNVVALIGIGGGSTNGGARNPGGWTDDAIHNAAIEEGLFRMGSFQTRRWIDKGTRNLAAVGITKTSPRMELSVTRDGTTVPITIWFGKRAVRNNIYAATVLPGESEVTLFEFPGDIYDLLARAGLVPAQ